MDAEEAMRLLKQTTSIRGLREVTTKRLMQKLLASDDVKASDKEKLHNLLKNTDSSGLVKMERNWL